LVLAKKKRDEKRRKKGVKKGERKERERDKKEGVYKKRRMRKEGSESELASSTHVKGYLVHAFKLWQYTLAEEHFATWLHPTLLSRACKALP